MALDQRSGALLPITSSAPLMGKALAGGVSTLPSLRIGRKRKTCTPKRSAVVLRASQFRRILLVGKPSAELPQMAELDDY